MSISMMDIGWAAGFLEGEGSFSLLSKIDPRVTAVQVEIDPLEKLVRLFGGKIYPRKPAGFGKKPINFWNLGGTSAVALMMVIYPLMSRKRQKKILEILTFWRTKGAKFGQYHYGSVLSDDAAKQAIIKVFNGESLLSVARSFGIHHTVLHLWVTGKNRSYLLSQLGLSPLKREHQVGAHHYRAALSDDDALCAMRRVISGEKIYRVAEEYGISGEALSFWMQGKKRPSLIMTLRREGLISSDIFISEPLPYSISDDVALIAMRRVRNGELLTHVALSTGIGYSKLSSWLSGQRRPYLLARLMQEEHVVKEV